MINLNDLTLTQLQDVIAEAGEPKFRAKQTFTRLHRGERVEEITNLSKTLRQRLVEETLDTLPEVEEKLVGGVHGNGEVSIGSQP